ncbi:cytochrome b-c1 complex subunit [Lynx pardinus]|uniref:Cytochrome b-c1 complex subunit n=1 Tax=Lynx pardinus TaxID=191816 RepID=A0A485M8Y6_LYNPA|nr:cytochrome b-c1 complex subunit [Lynx pardinus]
MAASAVCRAASAGTRVLLRTHRSPALLRSPALRTTATFAQALQSVPETQVSLLDNGLRVASEQSSQPTCTVGVWIDVGSRYETEKNNGAGYFLEHLAFKGTKNRPGNALEKEVESMGAHLNAYSTREHTAYYIKALSKDLPKAVELLADIVQNCALEDSQIEKERDVILQELQENDACMRDVVFDYLHATAFQGTPLAQAVEGPSGNVRKLSRADLTEYVSRHYKAPRMVLAAAGGVEHRQLVDLAQKHFSGISETYTEDAVPTLAPCRFTGSEVGGLVGRGSVLSWGLWKDACVQGYLHDSKGASGVVNGSCGCCLTSTHVHARIGMLYPHPVPFLVARTLWPSLSLAMYCFRSATATMLCHWPMWLLR